MAKFHRPWVPAVLAADTDLEIRTNASPEFDGHPHDLSHTGYVEGRERVIGEHALLDVVTEESRLRVVPRDAEHRLGEIVRSKREELGRPGDLVRRQGRPGDLDHRPELVWDLLPLFIHHFPRLGFHEPTLGPKLVHV